MESLANVHHFGCCQTKNELNYIHVVCFQPGSNSETAGPDEVKWILGPIKDNII